MQGQHRHHGAAAFVACFLVPLVYGAHRFRHDLHDSGATAASVASSGHVSSMAMHGASGAPMHQGAASMGQFNVQAFGATGDGTTDDTVAFAKALQAASDAGGGLVFAPAAQYLLKGNLSIPGGVTLKGSYEMVPSHDCRGGKWASLNISDGSVLIPTGGRGTPCDIDCTSAFITIVGNGVLQGFTIVYKEQERTALPVSYPWTIFMNGANAAVTDVELLGAWNGIAAVAAHRHYIARVQGQPINIGVFVDETYDIGRIEDVHFNPWFSSGHPFVYYQTTFGRAFVMGRSDWEYVFNTFAFGYAIGYHFIERASGSMNGNFLGIGMDLATNASVQVDQSQPYGILITNGEFTAFCDTSHAFCQAPGHDRSPRHVVVGPKNKGAVKFVNSAFWGPAVQVAETGGTGTVTFSQCHFDAWDSHVSVDGKSFTHNGTAAIDQLSGSLIVTTSEFTGGFADKDRTHVRVGAAATKTIITNNIITGTLKVARTSAKTKIIVNSNADDSATDEEDQTLI